MGCYMVKPYDVTTVVSRSYISEQLQNGMQKAQEQHNAQFLQEFQKTAEKKGQAVAKPEQADNPNISKEAIKRLEEKEKREKRRKQHQQELLHSDEDTDKVDKESMPLIDLKA